jgi:hypothetical protein
MHKHRIAVLAALAGALLSTAASAQEFSIRGTWSGHRERISWTEGYRNGDATLTVDEQQGRTFKGKMRWTTPGGDVTEDLVGAFTPDGRLISGADAEGSYAFALIDPNTMDYCYSEHGQGFRTTCARLTRKP